MSPKQLNDKIGGRQRPYNVLEALPVYVVLLDKDYRISFANKFFRERFGEPRGRRCYEHLFKRREPCENCQTYKAMETNAPHRWEWAGPDGRTYDIYDYPFLEADGSMLILEMGIDITARKESEELLRQSESRYRSIAATALDGFWQVDTQGRFLDANDSACRMLGYSRDEMLKMKVSDIEAAEDARMVKRHIEKMVSMGGDRFESRHRRKDGTFIDVEVSTTFVQDALGERIYTFVHEITERKRVEGKVKHLALFPQLNPNPVIEVDAKGEISFSNLATVRILEDLNAAKQIKLFLPEDFPQIAKALDSTKTTEFSREVRIKDRFFIESLLVVPELKAVRIYAHDITSLKLAEEQLRKTHDELESRVAERTSQLTELNKELNNEISMRIEIENQIRARNIVLKLLGSCSSRKSCADALVKLISRWAKCRCVGMRLLDEEGRIPYESYVGFSREFWEYENWLSLKDDECACTRVMRGRPEAVDRKLMTEHGSFHLNRASEFVRKLSREDKSKFRGVCVKNGFNSLAVIPLRNKEKIIGAIHLADEAEDKAGTKTIGFIESLSSIIADGIHKFNLEDKIRRDHALLDAFFQHSINPFVFLDRDFNFIRVNQAYADVCKRDASEFIGHNHFEFYPHEENEGVFRRVVQTKKPYQAYAKAFVFPDQPERGVTYWDWTLVPILDENEEVFLLVFSLNDVTEQKLQQERLIAAHQELEQTRRLSDIGTLAAVVAHELRNPLAAMRMAAFNIKRKAQNPLLDRHLENIEIKVSESDQIISNLLFYSRIKAPRYERVDIERVLKEVIGHTKSIYRQQRVSVVTDFRYLKDIKAEADPLQLKEVFFNILNNAYDALADKPGGRIEISAKAMDNDNILIVEIKDNGTGIDQEHMTRLSEPFFTTKAKGTGLGLTVCQQVVKLHGGTISFKSQKGMGTRVSVTIPIKR